MSQMASYQRRVRLWTEKCFGDVICLDRPTRRAQFFEEACELIQASELPLNIAMAILKNVYDKVPGNMNDETGDVMVSFDALCNSYDLSMQAEAEDALERCTTNIETIREKQKSKPFHKHIED